MKNFVSYNKFIRNVIFLSVIYIIVLFLFYGKFIQSTSIEKSIKDDSNIIGELVFNNLYTVMRMGGDKKLLDETCKSIYTLDKSYDMSKYKTPEIDTTTSRPRFMGDVKVVRDGKEITLENVQFFTYYADEDAEKENKPTVAFDFAVEPIEKNVGTVLGETFTQTCSMAKTVWTSLVWLVQGRFTFNDMSGPVGIATAVTQVASMGLQTGFGDAVNNILFVMILITVNLGIVNMLPFPALDGGRFLFLLIEWIFKKPIPRKAEQIVNTVGLVLLLAFMLIISVKDVFQLVTGTFPGM